jgi:DNA polymerase II large subunit
MVGQMLSYHFLRDMQGCLSRFARQEFRCQRCGEKYRRLPLSGWCSRWDCQGKIVLTVTRGFVVKYLQQARDLVRRYRLEGYVAQRLDLIAEHVDSTFGGTGPSRTIETWGE